MTELETLALKLFKKKHNGKNKNMTWADVNQNTRTKYKRLAWEKLNEGKDES